MTYMALARKWRPKQFSEVVGQAHVVKALSNALNNERVHHAYLLTGTRGVGKTTLARIFAKSLNCETGVSAEPCQQCSVCTSVDQGNYVDLIEVDAASRTGIDDMRELLDNVQYAPTSGHYKVYLIDEVHMLSKSSFNALLKTLEEPPEHVKFLFATTDPQKLPITVLSRCLQFNLQALQPDQISEQIAHILSTENIPHSTVAINLLARAADGSMRDSLSLLEQAIAQGGGDVQEEAVRSMLGTVKSKHLDDLLSALIASDGDAVLQVIHNMAAYAIDFQAALDQLLLDLHHISLAHLAPKALENKVDDIEKYRLYATHISIEDVQLFYQIGLISKRDLPLAPDHRSGFEMAMLRMVAFKPEASRQHIAPPLSNLNSSDTPNNSNTSNNASATSASTSNAATNEESVRDSANSAIESEQGSLRTDLANNVDNGTASDAATNAATTTPSVRPQTIPQTTPQSSATTSQAATEHTAQGSHAANQHLEQPAASPAANLPTDSNANPTLKPTIKTVAPTPPVTPAALPTDRVVTTDSNQLLQPIAGTPTIEHHDKQTGRIAPSLSSDVRAEQQTANVPATGEQTPLSAVTPPTATAATDTSTITPANAAMEPTLAPRVTPTITTPTTAAADLPTESTPSFDINSSDHAQSQINGNHSDGRQAPSFAAQTNHEIAAQSTEQSPNNSAAPVSSAAPTTTPVAPAAPTPTSLETGDQLANQGARVEPSFAPTTPQVNETFNKPVNEEPVNEPAAYTPAVVEPTLTQTTPVTPRSIEQAPSQNHSQSTQHFTEQTRAGYNTSSVDSSPQVNPTAPTTPAADQATTTQAPHSPQASPAVWAGMVERLNLNGLIKELAMNMACDDITADPMVLKMAPSFQFLHNQPREESIANEIRKVRADNCAVKIIFEDTVAETPAERLKRLEEEELQDTKQYLSNDQGVQDLMNTFDLSMNEASIKPNNSGHN